MPVKSGVVVDNMCAKRTTSKETRLTSLSRIFQAGFVATIAGMSCSALAQGDARFCGNYAKNASEVAGAAMKKNLACLDPSRGVHDNYQSHFDWCMKNPPSSVQGAEANIRRLAAQCTGTPPKAAPAPQAKANVGATSEEPFGPGFDGWKFTQQGTKQGVLCRAILGPYIIGRHTDARMYVSMPAGRMSAGSYPETYFAIGRDSEPALARSDGKRFAIDSDEGFLNKLASTPAYSWRAGPVNGQILEGRVNFNQSTGRALKELRACT